MMHLTKSVPLSSFMMKQYILFGLACFLCFTKGTSFLLLDSLSAVTDPEANMNVMETIKFNGYPVESHDVTTKDGYILTMFRIPFGVKNTNKPRAVVFLQHGLLDSSFTWVSNGPQQSLAFILADNGFDVWLGNSRGNLYSKRHIEYSTSSNKFWDFTWDEMAQYDLPASINYALLHSKASKLSYVGHSQGTEIGFAEFSRNSDLKSKVSAFVALAPVVYLGHTKTIVAKLADLTGTIHFVSNLLMAGEYLPNTKLITMLSQLACGNKVGSAVCSNIAFILQGFNADNLNASRMPIYMSHTPAGTSSKNMNHYAQSIRTNKFQYYDHGKLGNLRRYRQLSTPQYKLDLKDLPVAMFYGEKDTMAVPEDVERAIKELGDAVKLKKFVRKYNHIDFIWGMDAHAIVYPDLINFLKKYNQ